MRGFATNGELFALFLSNQIVIVNLITGNLSGRGRPRGLQKRFVQNNEFRERLGLQEDEGEDTAAALRR